MRRMILLLSAITMVALAVSKTAGQGYVITAYRGNDYAQFTLDPNSFLVWTNVTVTPGVVECIYTNSLLDYTTVVSGVTNSSSARGRVIVRDGINTTWDDLVQIATGTAPLISVHFNYQTFSDLALSTGLNTLQYNLNSATAMYIQFPASSQANITSLTITAVPEPSMLGLMGIGAVSVLMHGRRKT